MTREEIAQYIKSELANDDTEIYLDVDDYKIIVKALEQEPCDDTVSRKAVFEAIDDCNSDGLKGIFCSYDDGERFKEYIKKLPPVTPQEPRKGHWITDAKTYYEELNKRGLGVDEYTPYFTDDIACSECLAKYSMLDNETQFFKYCPNCGSDNR